QPVHFENRARTIRPRDDRESAPRIAKVRDAQGVAGAVEQDAEAIGECAGALEVVVEWCGEANDLDVVLDLMRGKVVATERVKQSAAGVIEESASEPRDVDAGAFS